MASFPVVIVNAFSTQADGGNPAAVCVVESWPQDEAMRGIAMAAGPSVTAFVQPLHNDVVPLRWFTRGGREVLSFCGHATFAAAHVLTERQPGLKDFSFDAVSGNFGIRLRGDQIGMLSQAWWVKPHHLSDSLTYGLGSRPDRCLRGERDWLLIYDDVTTIADLRPDFAMPYHYHEE